MDNACKWHCAQNALLQNLYRIHTQSFTQSHNPIEACTVPSAYSQHDGEVAVHQAPEEQRMVGNLVVYHTDAVAEVAADAY